LQLRKMQDRLDVRAMRFAYEATNSSGRIFTGVVEATDENKAVEQVRSIGFIPIKVNKTKRKVSGATMKKTIRELIGIR
tara:strand:+ start:89827 stop:90063 length:237 start_codon:yes stop_codon:yes gene_type:complete